MQNLCVSNLGTGSANAMEADLSVVLAHVGRDIPVSGMMTGTQKAGVTGELSMVYHHEQYD